MGFEPIPAEPQSAVLTINTKATMMVGVTGLEPAFPFWDSAPNGVGSQLPHTPTKD